MGSRKVDAMEPKDRRRQSRSFFRFGIRGMLLLFVVLAALGALVGPSLRFSYIERQTKHRWRQQDRAVKELTGAIQANDTPTAQAALERAVEARMPFDNKVGLSLLWRSIANGQLDITESLLVHGADPNYHEYIADDTALFAAIKSKHPKTTLRPRVPLAVRLKMIKLLLAHGADPLQSVGGTDPMGLAVQLHEAEAAHLLREHGVPYGPREMAAFGELDDLRRLVDKNPDIVRERVIPPYKTKPEWEPTLLSMAIERGHHEMAIYLIEQGSSVNTMQYGTSGLHVAGRNNDLELVKMLLARGADVDAIDAYDCTPLLHCAQRKVPEVMVALIEAGADVNHQSEATRGWTALHAAANTGDTETLRILLEAGADPSIKDDDGKTAAELANDEVAKLLPASEGEHTPE